MATTDLVRPTRQPGRAPRRHPWRRARGAGRYAVTLAWVVLFLVPFVVMFRTAVSAPDAIYSTALQLWPSSWTLDNFAAAFERIPLGRYFLNTLLISVLSVAGMLVSSPLVAYSLAKTHWRGRDTLFVLVLATMMLPPQVTMIPLYMMWNGIGQTDSYLPLIVPSLFGTPFIIFLLRQFLRNIPDELLDAARVDGAGELRIYRSIVLPLMRPALVTAAVFHFQAAWTDFLGPLLYINDADKFTLSLGLNAFFGQYGIEWGPLMAACALFTLPTLLIFVAANKYFVGGQMAGALK